jgi:hypothetical protein
MQKLLHVYRFSGFVRQKPSGVFEKCSGVALHFSKQSVPRFAFRCGELVEFDLLFGSLFTSSSWPELGSDEHLIVILE